MLATLPQAVAVHIEACVWAFSSTIQAKKSTCVPFIQVVTFAAQVITSVCAKNKCVMGSKTVPMDLMNQTGVVSHSACSWWSCETACHCQLSLYTISSTSKTA